MIVIIRIHLPISSFKSLCYMDDLAWVRLCLFLRDPIPRPFRKRPWMSSSDSEEDEGKKRQKNKCCYS